MKKQIILFTLMLACFSIFCQEYDFSKEYNKIITVNKYDETKNWLNEHKKDFDDYMACCPDNIITIAYEAKKYNSMKAAMEFEPKLLNMFISSCSGGHPSTPPTIFFCVMRNDFKYAEYFLQKGVSSNIVWEKPCEDPENLYSCAKSNEMRNLLKKYSCPETIDVDNYVCEINDTHVNVRDCPDIKKGKVLFQVNKSERGTITKSTWYYNKIADQTERWYFIKFDNEKSGWIFGQYAHVFRYDGM